MSRKFLVPAVGVVGVVILVAGAWRLLDSGKAKAASCAELNLQDFGTVHDEYMTRFSVGKVDFAAEPPIPRYESGVGHHYVFKFPVYLTKVTDETILIAGRNIESGEEMQFYDGGLPKQLGPLRLELGVVPRDFYAMAGSITALGVYEITVTGDGGKRLGASRIAFCNRVTVL